MDPCVTRLACQAIETGTITRADHALMFRSVIRQVRAGDVDDLFRLGLGLNLIDAQDMLPASPFLRLPVSVTDQLDRNFLMPPRLHGGVVCRSPYVSRVSFETLDPDDLVPVEISTDVFRAVRENSRINEIVHRSFYRLKSVNFSYLWSQNAATNFMGKTKEYFSNILQAHVLDFPNLVALEVMRSRLNTQHL